MQMKLKNLNLNYYRKVNITGILILFNFFVAHSDSSVLTFLPELVVDLSDDEALFFLLKTIS